MKKLILLCVLITLISCNSSAQEQKEAKQYKVSKTEAEWKEQLTDLQYYVLRKSGTERQFSSPLNKNYGKGTYVCAACETPLFESDYKYDSRSGWPSFDREIKGNVDFSVDYNIGYSRSEEHCATCGGHLGHVFNDGPKATTGQRHCINGAALKFIPKKDE
ncbi:MAG: peptide-methionine (R)-S-oxide reductase MsrB [Flavobacteriaceae bacterium]|nr:peptide-methionine (R)-S-oxide reductase MsrB [Flavobacteriaceae bacterium]